jgi:ATP-dependent RNA helicase DeaD
MSKFEDLGLSTDTLAVLKKKGFEVPSPIQAKTIPAIFSHNKDIIAQAQTGTGKTAAFGLPMLELLEENKRTTQAIVLAPTRELAIQVAEEISSLKGNKKLNVAPIYGGQSISIQLRSLRKGVDIIVGTPGRVIDHLNRGTIKLNEIKFLVLDEADEMLNMGFQEEIDEILKSVNPERRTMLFSATMPGSVLKIAKKYMGDYEVISVTTGEVTTSNTDQIYFEVSRSDKFEALCRIVDIEEDFYGIVFCKTKMDVDDINNHLHDRGYDSDALHGDISQALREKILQKFKNKRVNILVATDVAARGIDVKDISHVINYSIPHDPESYVHRIGRTGRAGKEGVAITFVTPSESRKLHIIQQRAKTTIRKEKLPKVKDVIKNKTTRIKSRLEKVLASDLNEEFISLANDLLEGKDSTSVLAAILQDSLKDELSSKSYVEIAEANVVDKQGRTRLFITMGTMDGLTNKKLNTIIQDKCSINSSKIMDMEIKEKFSFISLPFKEAEVVLAHFKRTKRRGDMTISKAKVEKRKGGGNGGFKGGSKSGSRGGTATRNRRR